MENFSNTAAIKAFTMKIIAIVHVDPPTQVKNEVRRISRLFRTENDVEVRVIVY